MPRQEYTGFHICSVVQETYAPGFYRYVCDCGNYRSPAFRLDTNAQNRARDEMSFHRLGTMDFDTTRPVPEQRESQQVPRNIISLDRADDTCEECVQYRCTCGWVAPSFHVGGAFHTESVREMQAHRCTGVREAPVQPSTPAPVHEHQPEDDGIVVLHTMIHGGITPQRAFSLSNIAEELCEADASNPTVRDVRTECQRARDRFATALQLIRDPAGNASSEAVRIALINAAAQAVLALEAYYIASPRMLVDAGLFHLPSLY